MAARPIQSLLVLMFVAAGCLAVGSCRTQPVGFTGPFDRLPESARMLRDGTAEELLDFLERRAPMHPTFWTRGRVVMEDRESSRSWFDATLLYRDPDGFRLRGSRPGIGTIFEVIVNGGRAWVYLNREGELYGGSVADLADVTWVLGGLSLRDFFGAIMVNQDLRRRIEDSSAAVVRTTRSHVELLRVTQRGEATRWRVRRRDALADQVVTTTPQTGFMPVRVTYQEYEAHDVVESYPSRLTLTIGEEPGDLIVRLRLREFKTAPELSDAVFDPPARPRSNFPLAALIERESVLPEGGAPEDEAGDP